MHELYLAEIDANDWNSVNPDLLRRIINTHRIDTRSDLSGLFSCLYLQLDNGVIHTAIEYNEGDATHLDTSSLVVRDINFEAPNRLIQYLEEVQESRLKLFGPLPANFKISKYADDFTIDYYGRITKSQFPFLPFEDMVLIAPEWFKGTLYLDYGNPKCVRIINPEIISESGTSPGIKSYPEIPFQMNTKIHNHSNYLGFSGVPLWVQGFDMPTCPKTGNMMEFLIGIDNAHDGFPIKLKHDRTVYFFVEPESKIVGVVHQYT